MHYGRWYEGPNGSDYRPGNTHDRRVSHSVARPVACAAG